MLYISNTLQKGIVTTIQISGRFNPSIQLFVCGLYVDSMLSLC